MALLTNRDVILKAASNLKTEEFEVPEWGGSVLVRELTGTERDKFEASTVERKGNNVKQNLENLRARLVSLCLVNEGGERVFNVKDLRELGNVGASGLDRVFIKCQEVNGLTVRDVEEMTENFGDDQSESSTSD